MGRSAAERIEQRLREDTPYWAGACVEIVSEKGQVVPFEMWPGQQKVWDVIQRQRAAGKPVRVIVLKSRRQGVSRFSMAHLVHRCTQHPHRRALVVAHDKSTPGELFDDAEKFYGGLPTAPEAPEWLKPPLRNRRNTEGNKLLHWGNPSRNDIAAGNVGIDSTLRIDTASEVEAGRGKTITDLLCSEVAFWQNPRKALSLQNAVFDEPGTTVIWESTANGNNFFKQRWDRAMRGESEYEPVFLSWLDDPKCQRPFDTPEERERFADHVGRGEWGHDEPELIARGATLEQLKWRRFAIVDKCDGKLDLFKQEYPSTPAEAFIASGNHVFSMSFVQKAVDSAQITDPQAEVGVLAETGSRTRRLLNGEIEVPTGAVWVPKQATGFAATHDFWRRWRLPCGCEVSDEGCVCGTAQNGQERPAGPRQYVIGVDVADGEANTDGEKAWHAVQVIDHLTGEQVAEYRSRVDTDLLTRDVFMAGHLYNEAWIAVEVTGSHGLPVARDLWHKYGYRKLYRRKAHESTREKQQDRLGWDTNRRTKPLMISLLTELLREGSHGIRSLQLALEFTTYIELPNGKQAPDDDAYSDLLLAYGIAEQVRTEIPHARAYDSGVAMQTNWRGPRRPR